MKTRIEHDSLGQMEIPNDVLYGIQTLRAHNNYPISGQKVSMDFIKAYALIKKSAAKVNNKIGKLDTLITEEIVTVSDEILAWKHDSQFIVDVYQAGAGTSTHMNVNEVITNRILEKRWELKWSYDILSPNDIVNMSQSTNDTFPTATRICLALLAPELMESLRDLKDSLLTQAKKHKTTLSSARTHLQDAVPITLGQVFQSYADTVDGLLQEYEIVVSKLKIIGIGGSAAGTGINTHPDYHDAMVECISQETKTRFYGNPNLIESMQSQRQIWNYMNCLSIIATELTRITSDLRLLSSGPHTGFAEVKLPPVQPGSSIMPGKVNPSILECVNMICFRVMGSRTSVEHCLSASQLNLNIFMPLMAHETIESTKILTQACSIMTEKAIHGLEVNIEKSKEYWFQSNGIFTALNPILGYSKVAKLVHQREQSSESIETLLLKNTDLSKEDIADILDPLKLSNIQ